METAPRGFPLTAAAGSETIESSEPGQRPTRAPLNPITSPIAGLFAGVENWEGVLS